MTTGAAIEYALAVFPEPNFEDDTIACATCGETATIEVTTDGPPEQSITICANCGSDE